MTTCLFSHSGVDDNLFVLTLWSGWQICFSVTLWSGWQLVCPHTLERVILCSSVVCHLLERVVILMFSRVATGSVLEVSQNIIGLTAILIIMSFFTFKTDIILCIKISIILSINIVFLCVLHCRADMWGSLSVNVCVIVTLFLICNQFYNTYRSFYKLYHIPVNNVMMCASDLIFLEIIFFYSSTCTFVLSPFYSTWSCYKM